MANEIEIAYITGRTTYALVRNSVGLIWNTSTVAFEAYNSSNYANYVIQLTEQSTSGFYAGTFPAAIVGGAYGIVAKNQGGGSPVETDGYIGGGDFQWSGTAEFALVTLATSGQVAGGFPIKIYRGEMVLNFPIYLKSAADHITPFTSGVCSGQILRDSGSFTALQSGAFTEKGLGFYQCVLTSGDLQANTVSLLFTATGVSGGVSDPLPMSMILQKTSGQT